MTSIHPCEVRLIHVSGSQLARELASNELSITSRLECLQGVSDPDLISHAITLIRSQADLVNARIFLPALHRRQIELWLEP